MSYAEQVVVLFYIFPRGLQPLKVEVQPFRIYYIRAKQSHWKRHKTNGAGHTGAAELHPRLIFLQRAPFLFHLIALLPFTPERNYSLRVSE